MTSHKRTGDSALFLIIGAYLLFVLSIGLPWYLIGKDIVSREAGITGGVFGFLITWVFVLFVGPYTEERK